jgi:hypothetical protein
VTWPGKSHSRNGRCLSSMGGCVQFPVFDFCAMF